jgi:hypothetical protein
MSKMDGLRAMREARYERAAARASAPKARRGRPSQARVESPAEPATATPAPPDPAPDVTGPDPARCGHRAISGRTCTREAGHAAKSHRYS